MGGRATAAATERAAAKRRAVKGDNGGAPAAKRQKPAGTSVIAPVEASSSAMGGGAMGGGSIPYSDGELEAEVEMVLALLFAGTRDECTFDELFAHLARDPRVAVCGRDAVTRVLGTMEAANKVIYREGRVHLI